MNETVGLFNWNWIADELKRGEEQEEWVVSVGGVMQMNTQR